MKIAIVHDDLVRRGGAERVALSFHYAFPDAPIYTIAYRKELTYPEFEDCRIITSWFQKIAVNEKILKWAFFPFGMWAMQQLDVSEYDVVLMSSTYCAKYVKLKKTAIVINYCHSPFRLAWYPESYNEVVNGKGLKKWLFKLIISILRKVDYRSSLRTDYFIANTPLMAEKIRQVYTPRNEVSVINPPVSCSNFFVKEKVENYFLVVCRLEYYKRVDIAIAAFNQLQLPLIVVGKGTQYEKLKKLAGRNITFKSGLSKEELALHYSNCKALIFPQIEDYGITPLEANASGRPVIAFGEGGVLETMIPYGTQSDKFTAILFDQQNEQSLIAAVKLYETLEVDSSFIRSNAEKFDEPVFIEKIKNYIVQKVPSRLPYNNTNG